MEYFSIEDFQKEEEFDTAKFVEEAEEKLSLKWLESIKQGHCKKFVKPTLEDVKQGLKKTKQSLHIQLVELLNKDYQKFISLSTDLQDCPASLQKIHGALSSLQKRNRSVQNQLKHKVAEVDQRLQTKAKLKEKKILLQQVVEIVQLLEKVKALVRKNKNKPQETKFDSYLRKINSGGAKGEQFQRLKSCFETERLARMYARINTLQKQVGNFEIVKKLEQEIKTISNEVLGRLRQTLVSGIQNQDDTVCRCGLRSYSVLNSNHVAEEIVKHDIIRPLTEKHLPSHLFEQKLTKKAQVEEGFQSISDDVERLCSILLKQSSGVGKFNFVKKSIWKHIREHLEKQLEPKKLFFPVFEDVFHLYYSQTFQLFRKLQSMCENGEELYNDAATIAFRKRWSPSTYYLLQFQQITSKFRKGLKLDLLENEKFCVKAMSKAEEWVRYCWSKDVFLPELGNKFLELHVGIIGNLASYCKENLENCKNANIMVAMICDVEKLFEAELFQDLPRTVLHSILSDDDLEICFSSQHASLQQLQDDLFSLLVKQTTEKCTTPLTQVRQIKSRYHMTGREVDTVPSQYVSSLLQPLQTLENTFTKQLRSDLRLELLEQIIASLIESFTERVKELLTAIEKSAKLLKRLRKKQNDSLLSDDAKIRMQLKLDIDSFCDNLRSLPETHPILCQSFSFSGNRDDLVRLKNLP